MNWRWAGLNELWQRIWERPSLTAVTGRNLSTFTVLDVGTEYVKSLVVQVAEGRGQVIGVGRQHQGECAMSAGVVADISAVVANCDLALRQAEDMTEEVVGHKVVPDAVVMGIAGEHVVGTAATVEARRPQPARPITEAEVAALLRRAERLAWNQVRESLAFATGQERIEVSLVNAHVVEVQIDGHAVANPLRFKGSNLGVTVYNAFAPLVHLGALQSVAADLELAVIAIVAEPYAVARGLSVGDGLFIDVGGGTTDVALVRQRRLESTRSYSLGGRAFTRRLARTLDLPWERAESLKIDYARGRLPVEEAQRIRQMLAGDAQTWMEGLEILLTDLAGARPLPPHIYLCGGGAGLPDLLDALRLFPWLQQLPFARQPEVTLVQPREVVGLTDCTRLLISSQDVTPLGLAAQALHFGRDLEHHDRILQQVVRALKM